jgi:sporulation protein YlmC with PRC-barrel domain
MKIEIKKSYRCSNLVGMPVKNSRGEDVGTIEEIVIDLDRNRLVYAALSFGGFLGVGSKVFAIPWEAMSLKFDERNTYFLLDVDREKLKAAPGFPRENWPDLSDPNWAKEIDAFYRDKEEAKKPDREPAAVAPSEEGIPATPARREPLAEEEPSEPLVSSTREREGVGAAAR